MGNWFDLKGRPLKSTKGKTHLSSHHPRGLKDELLVCLLAFQDLFMI